MDELREIEEMLSELNEWDDIQECMIDAETKYMKEI